MRAAGRARSDARAAGAAARDDSGFARSSIELIGITIRGARHNARLEGRLAGLHTNTLPTCCVVRGNNS